MLFIFNDSKIQTKFEVTVSVANAIAQKEKPLTKTVVLDLYVLMPFLWGLDFSIIQKSKRMNSFTVWKDYLIRQIFRS